MGQRISRHRAGHTAAQKRNDAYRELCVDNKMVLNPKKFRMIGDVIMPVPSWERRAQCRVAKGLAKTVRMTPIVSKRQSHIIVECIAEVVYR